MLQDQVYVLDCLAYVCYIYGYCDDCLFCCLLDSAVVDATSFPFV